MIGPPLQPVSHTQLKMHICMYDGSILRKGEEREEGRYLFISSCNRQCSCYCFAIVMCIVNAAMNAALCAASHAENFKPLYLGLGLK